MKHISEKLNKNKSDDSALTNVILERIERENVKPLPKWQFVCHEYTLRLFWVLTVVLGAVSFSVMLYTGVYASFAMHEATHDSFGYFLLENLPYIWITVFILMSALAYLNFRKTKRGYKYSLLVILLSSIALSVVGGAFLHALGFGYVIDYRLGQAMPMYMSIEKKDMYLWQQPEDGRIVGVFFPPRIDGREIIFIDVHDEAWSMNIGSLLEPDLEILFSEEKVRVLGVLSTTTDDYFYACGVFPWMYNRDLGMRAMQNERNEFVRRMYEQKERFQERLEALEDEIFDSNEHIVPMGICAKHKAIGRIEKSMR